RRLIGARKLSSRELTQSCIRRIEAVDHAVNAMVARSFEAALAEADAADAMVARGAALPLLHGLPVGIKDLEETAGLRTTYGSPIFRDFVPQEDAGVVARVRAAGGIVLGKTNVPEFGLGANTRNSVYGATGNPFDPSRSAAGSSGGSAVALATGMVPLATGSDTGGSLRNPAAFCGVVGFRPTPGLVPAAIVSDDARDPLATTIYGRAVRRAEDFAQPGAVDLTSVRAAFSPDLGFAPTERHIARVFAAKCALFRRAFASAEDAAPDCTGADEAFEVLRAVGVLGNHLEKVRTRPQDCGPNVHANVEEGLRYTAADVARAQSLQTAMYRRWQASFAGFDVLITPGITISPRDWRELYPAEIDGQPTRTYFHWLSLAYAATLAGHPAMCLPVGRDEAGLPFGMQI